MTELLSERIWSRMGAEQDGYMTVDGKGTPFAGGGLSAGLRDLGRVGQMMLDGGVINGTRLFPARVVGSVRQGGDRDAFARAGYATIPGGSYRSMWWVLHNAHGAYAARGVHGQTIYVDPTAEMVIVRLASHPATRACRRRGGPGSAGCSSRRVTPRALLVCRAAPGSARRRAARRRAAHP